MKLRTSCLLLVYVTISILTSTEVDGIRCCVGVAKIPKRMLRAVSRYQIQDKSGGPCDIDAVLLFIKHLIICADPAVVKHLKKLKKPYKP